MTSMLKQSAYIAGLLFGLLLFSIAGEYTVSPVFQDCVDQQKRHHEENAADYYPSTFDILRAYAVCSGDFVNRNGTGISALATIVIAAFTITLWIASREQARLTREALIAANRAFMFPTGLKQVFEMDIATGLYNWRLRPEWRNSGETPTKNLTTYVECEIRNSLLPANYGFIHDTDPASGIIGPNQTIWGGNAPRGAAITPQDILETQVYRKFIYLWGWAKYRDVFPATSQHTTRFCWLILVTGDPMKFDPIVVGQPPTPGTVSFQYLQHTEGNSAD